MSENWTGDERREATPEEERHAQQDIAAVRMNKFLNRIDVYKQTVGAALLCFLIILGTMAYGIVVTNERAKENQKLYKDTVRCVAALTAREENRSRVLEACAEFREEMR